MQKLVSEENGISTRSGSNSNQQLVTLQSQHDTTLEELKRYKLLVENVQDYARFFMDPKGYIKTWNKGAEKNKGYTSREIIGKHFSNFYMQEDIDTDKPGRELEIARKVGRVEDEGWRVRKDGTKFWANVVITALTEDGKLVGFAKVTRNLTDRKEQEDGLRRANQLLKQQQAELQELNNAKEEFISLASHQLRTPATGIKQLLGFILEGFQDGVSDDAMKFIEKSYASNERLLSIITSLLKVAQIDAGEVKLRKNAVDIHTTIRKIIDEFQYTSMSRGNEIISSLGSQPLFADVDEDYFRMALENILDNASKYSSEGKAIDISVIEKDDCIAISVKDSGVGIAHGDLSKIFTKFHRVNHDLAHKVAGSGLGLYWTKKVIQLHGGSIAVESKPGIGTTFIISLPKSSLNA